MELNKLKEIRKAIGIQILNSREKVGSNELHKLVIIADELTDLIKYLENPINYNKEKEKFNKLMNPDKIKKKYKEDYEW